MRAPDNLDAFNAYEREKERQKRYYKEEIETEEEKDEFKEVCFYVNEREEDIEFLERFLNKYDFAYEKEVL